MNRSATSLRVSLSSFLLLALFSPNLVPGVFAQRRRAAQGAARGLQPEVSRMLREINAGNIERTVRKLVSFGTRNTLSAQDDPARGVGAARDWLFREFKEISSQTGGRLEVELQSFEQQPGRFQRIARPTRVTNVVARLPGTPKQQKTNVEAMFTNDIVGNTLGGNGVRDRRTLRVFAEGVPSAETPEEAATRRSVGGENDSAPRQLARFVVETSAGYLPGFRVQMVYRRDRYLRGGDHIPFLEQGYPAVRFSEPNEDYNHQHQNVRVEGGVRYGDLPEFVDFEYVAQVARVNCAALAALALAPARPTDVRILTRRLTNDTDLQWAANTEPDLAGYEIVWRDTTSPVWTHALRVGRVTSHTVKGMSKDNYFFGVRAVDAEGNRSPATYPRPLGR
ncbi:MAG: hypothetical protein LC802_21570 [Acidobacteria bacterium]|nr:hypothetical protein [Acidobacteriota bacterium]